ncbi:putative glutathione S-transferase 8 [Ditylenchus destructor]|nr:putative glutathione S-transferase 8 [Ditylenchus destructor]
MVQYKLHYSDARGRAEAIRLIFAFANEPFEDVRLKMEDWANQKSKYKYGKVPVLEVDGKQLAQSMAIARYLAERFGIAGKNAWEKAQLHEIVDFQKDVYTDLAPYYLVMLGFKQGDKDAVRKDVFLPAAEQRFPQFVRLLKESGSGFFAPSGLTYVDFIVGDYLEHWVKELEPQFMKPIRLIFKYAGQPFEDVRIKMEDWPKHKPKFKYGTIPVLEVDGKQLCQSTAIARYLAEKFGLAGKNEWEKAQVHEIVDYHLDAVALRKDVFLPAAARIFPQYIKQLKESKSGFLASSGLTYVDFIVADYLEYWVSKLEPQFMKENYPEIGAYVNKVYSVPQIKDYIKNRKD